MPKGRTIVSDNAKDDVEFFYLLGALKGDGHYNFKTRHIQISVIDLDFLVYLKSIIKKLIPTWKGDITKQTEQKGNSKPQWRISIGSKDFFIKKLYDLMPQTREEIIWYLKGLFDAEGSVSYHYRIANMSPVYSKTHKRPYKHLQRIIGLAQSNTLDLLKWSGWLNDIGIKNKLHLRDDGRSSLNIRRTDAIRKFHSLINFKIKRKREKLEGLMPLLSYSYNIIDKVKIKSIKYIGRKYTYDLQVPHYNNFILANNIITHNSGKSTITSTLCSFCDPSFNLTKLVFTVPQFFEAIDNSPPGTAIQWDEAVFGGLTTEALSNVQNALIKKMTLIRKKKLYIFIIIPSLFMLRLYFAVFRTRALIHCYTPDGIERGYFKFYSYDNKRKLYVLGKKFMNMMVVKPDFRGKFVDTENYFYNQEEYEKKKDEASKIINEKDKKEDGTPTQRAITKRSLFMSKMFLQRIMIREKLNSKEMLQIYPWLPWKERHLRIIQNDSSLNNKKAAEYFDDVDIQEKEEKKIPELVMPNEISLLKVKNIKK